jgi:hypothetical protein
MYFWCEFLCNLWWWPLNLLWSWLVCMLVWNPSGFHGLPGYTGLSLLNHLLGGWFSYLISYNWSVLLQLVSEHGLAYLLFTSVFKTKNCLKNVIYKLKVCQWSYPLCLVRTLGGLFKYWLGGSCTIFIFRCSYDMLLYECHLIEW